ASEHPMFRIKYATARAACRLDADDRDGAFASLLAGIDATPAPAAATVDERVAWARALAGGGRCDDAVGVLRACLPAGLNHDGCALAVELLASDARPFVEAALDHHLELVQFSTDYNRCGEGATYLARLVARLDAPDLQTRLIAAVAVTQPYE